jgi:hypothetical protein
MIVLPAGTQDHATIATRRRDTISKSQLYHDEYKGVKGWLAFFCISLLILSPSFFLIGTLIDFAVSQKHFKRYEGFQIVFYTKMILGLLVVILGIRAGLALYQIKTGAVEIAKNFLLINLGVSIFLLILNLMIKLPYEFKNTKGFTTLFGLTMSLVSFGIWYSYLN